jgi:hypothetical protein
MATILRDNSFRGVEALVRSRARQAIGVKSAFGDDALAAFQRRMPVDRVRDTLWQVIYRAKRNKAFDGSRHIGLAIDGTGACKTEREPCDLCHPILDAKGTVVSRLHKFSMVIVVGTGLSLPFDVEYYGPRDSEYAASQRLLERSLLGLGNRFADYVAGDGEYATAPFLNLARRKGIKVVARLKGNLPTLFAAAQARFSAVPPSRTFDHGRDKVEIWDADDFDPWDGLVWETVRVIRYRQTKPDGLVVEAYWLTDWEIEVVDSIGVFKMAKSRWEIENQGFNDGKNRNGLERLRTHDPNSMLVTGLVILPAIVIERLFRCRHLRRGSHRIRTPIAFLRDLQKNLGFRENAA